MNRRFLAVGVPVLVAGMVLAGCSLLRVSPSVDFVASSVEGRAPLVVAFDALVDGTPVSYAWNFGDGRTSRDPDPINIYTKAGTYGVMLTVGFADHEPVVLLKKRFVTVEEPLRQASTVYLYWIASHILRRGSWNGGPSQWLASEWYPPNGMDVGGGKVYWVTTTGIGGELSSMDLDGSNRQILLEEENRLGGVAVDVKQGKIYWTCWPESPRSVFQPNRRWDGALKRANLDGSDVEILIEYPSGSPTYADQVVVDPDAGLVFWSLVGDGYEGVIQMSRTSPFDPHDHIYDVGCPRGMALDTIPDYGARHLYYTTADELRCVNLYWPTTTTILTGLDSPAGVAIDYIGYRLYVGTAQGILRATTDGTNLETLYPDEEQVSSVILPR